MTDTTAPRTDDQATSLPADNPFAGRSDLPYALPPFDRIREEHLAPALRAGMALQRAEWEAIATAPGEPDLAGTVEALERSGRLLDRARSVLGALSLAHGTPGIRDVDAELAPLLSAHSDARYLDPRLFARLDRLHERRLDLDLSPEQLRLVERYHRDFVRAGAGLGEAEKSRLSEINTELATLSRSFDTMLLDASNAAAVHVTEPERLAGLGPGAVAAAAVSAEARGLGGWLLTLVLPTPQPALASLHDRDLRRRLHEAAVGRCWQGEHDTRPLVVRLVALRAERAALLGAPSHADHVLADQTAATVDAVTAVLAGMAPAAVANARGEAEELEQLLHADGLDGPLQPWDHAYYAERLRQERFAVDADALRPYLELDRVLRDGVLLAAELLYGLRFTERPDLPGYHRDVRTFEVHDHDGHGLGLFVGDFFARDTKRGGAWMTSFVDQSDLLGERPVVTVCMNVPRPPDGEPALLSPSEVDTAFHEFGHALHGLLSAVRYPRFSGTSVPRDFVEFPSQVNELWAWHRQVLPRYARHHLSGEPLPPQQVQALQAALGYGEGFRTTEYLAATVLDLAWHSLPAGREVAVQDVAAFEAEALAAYGLDVASVPPRYRSTYFAHVFAGGYSAGYYGYIWSEVLDAELVDWFTENGGLLRANGDRFRAELLSRGGAVDPMAAFEAVRGRAPRPEPLLRRRHLLPT